MTTSRKSSRRQEREKLRSARSQKPKIRLTLPIIIFISVIVVIGFLIYRLLFTPFEYGILSVAVSNADGSASLLLYDFNEPSITNYIIPPETQVLMAKERGSWRMKSVWKLIETDKLDRSVFSDSLMRTLRLPIDEWADRVFLDFQEGNFAVNIKSVFVPGTSSLSIRDRIRLALFARNVRGANRTIVNLNETGFLSEEILKDGEKGYIVNSTIPSSIQGKFSEPELTSLPLRVQIKNPDGSRDVTTRTVAEIVETLGANVVAITAEEEIGTKECSVFSKEGSLGVKKVAAVFRCNYKVEQAIGNYDMVINLSENFMKRF